MANPVSSLLFGDVANASDLPIRWTRPTFGTFLYLSLLWGFSTGVPLGIASFLVSLFGVETSATVLFWQFHGVTAGAADILLAPVIFAMFGLWGGILFPLYRLGVIVSKGPRLCFQAEKGHRLHLSRLRFHSYVKLSALLGFLAAMFFSILLVVVAGISKVDDFTVAAVPLPFHGAARLVWAVLVTPILYTIYSAAAGILAFIPFRLVARTLPGAVLPANEIAACR